MKVSYVKLAEMAKKKISENKAAEFLIVQLCPAVEDKKTVVSVYSFLKANGTEVKTLSLESENQIENEMLALARSAEADCFMIIVSRIEEMGILANAARYMGMSGMILFKCKRTCMAMTAFDKDGIDTFLVHPLSLAYPDWIVPDKFDFISLAGACLYMMRKENSILRAADRVRKLLRVMEFDNR